MVIACLGFGERSNAAAVAPSTPSQIVTLITSKDTDACSGDFTLDLRVSPDGTSGQQFFIPLGQVLIVTGVDWVVNGLPGTTGDYVEGSLRIGATGHHIWSDMSARDPSGAAGKTSPVATPVVKAGSVLCFHTALAANPTGTAGAVFRLAVHGFLTRDR